MGSRIFLVDDHEIVRRGLRDLFNRESDLEVVGEAATVADALARIPLSNADVAVLDLGLPDGSGIEICRELRSSAPRMHSIILTSYDDEESLIEAALAGASGYALKQLKGNEIVATVRAAAQGRSTMNPDVTARSLERVRADREANEPLESLTDQEREILELIAMGKSNREIAEHMYLAEKTIKNRVTALFAKLGVSRRAQAAVYAARIMERYGTL
ncbi:MAG: response regulator transcription factor [Microthrixaceae bacterium]|nr:response regulator transcription factor [Microthrixaceae bacterium]MCO5312459.1 response regulator transcription factor [Microthrixaceae bacterium]